MRLTVHDVGHGQCISLIHDNGNVMLWDCGHTNDNSPSVFLPPLGITDIHYFYITNFDQDHISNLVDLRRNVNIRAYNGNHTISVEQLRNLKLQNGPLTSAMESALEIHGWTGGPPTPPHPFPGVELKHFYNPYSQDFPDTNNISFGTFVTCNNKKFIIPGDMESKGWRGLLVNNEFKAELQGVDVFIASHHGRENGYCEEIFEWCSPEVIVCSDSSIVHSTQEMASTYAEHASGITLTGTTNPRSVLTTRNDGDIYWDL